MPSSFDQNTVHQYGGVAWAKAQMDLLQPQAIEGQIQGYNLVRDSLNQIIGTLNTANASLQSAWVGDAAAAASQTFTDTSNHAQNVVTAVNNTISQLQNAKAAASDAQNAMRNVPNEVPLPNGGFFGGISNAFSDVLTGTDPRQQAEQHNTAVRTQAAEVLNKLSSSYDSAASNMNSIAAGHDSGFTPSSPPPTGGFNLGSGSYGGGSRAAGAYARTFSNGGGSAPSSAGVGNVKNGVFEDTHTALQSATTFPESITSTPTGPETITSNTANTLPEPIISSIGGGLNEPPSETNKLGPLTAEEPPLDEGLGGGGRARGSSKLSSSNVFGEEGFGNESGSMPRRSSSLGNGIFEGEGEPGGGGISSGNGAVIGEDQAGMRPGAGGRGGSAMSEEEQLGSSKYSRGRFFGGEEPGEGSDQWIQPSVGGNESLLVKDGESGSATGRVRSAYDEATDAEGNPLNILRGVGARAGGRDEDDERGARPGYLKEDPEWWQSVQEVAPPVVE